MAPLGDCMGTRVHHDAVDSNVNLQPRRNRYSSDTCLAVMTPRGQVGEPRKYRLALVNSSLTRENGVVQRVTVRTRLFVPISNRRNQFNLFHPWARHRGGSSGLSSIEGRGSPVDHSYQARLRLAVANVSTDKICPLICLGYSHTAPIRTPAFVIMLSCADLLEMRKILSQGPTGSWNIQHSWKSTVRVESGWYGGVPLPSMALT